MKKLVFFRKPIDIEPPAKSGLPKGYKPPEMKIDPFKKELMNQAFDIKHKAAVKVIKLLLHS